MFCYLGVVGEPYAQACTL